MAAIKDNPSPGFFEGLNYFSRGDLIKDTQLTSMQNLASMQAELRIDTGYILEDPGISGDPEIVQAYTLVDSDGIKYAFAFSIDQLFLWANAQWDEIKDSSGNSLNSTDRGVDRLTATGKYPIKAVTFVGSSSGATTGHSMIIFTNGVDPVHKVYYDGSGWVAEAIDGLQDISVTTARALGVWKDSVWVGNLIEDGDYYSYRIRWCVPTNEEQWDETTYASAGFYDLLGKADEILVLETLSDYMIAYRRGSIYRGTWTGSYQLPVYFDNMVANEGIIGHSAVANMNDWHIIVSPSNVYRYTGDRSLDPIGDMIHARVFGDNTLVENENRDFIQAVYVSERDVVWVMFPVWGDGTSPKTYVLRYNVKYKAWTERVFNLFFTSIGSIHNEVNDTWIGGDARSWALGPDRPWVSQDFLDTKPFLFFTTRNSGYSHYLIRYNFSQETDGAIGTYTATGDLTLTPDTGVAIAWVATTKDFREPMGYLETESLDLEIKGDEGTVITVSYSLDRGTTWHTWDTITLTTTVDSTEDYQMYTTWGYISCKSIRFKLSGSGGNVRLGQYNFRYRPEVR